MVPAGFPSYFHTLVSGTRLTWRYRTVCVNTSITDPTGNVMLLVLSVSVNVGDYN